MRAVAFACGLLAVLVGATVCQAGPYFSVGVRLGYPYHSPYYYGPYGYYRPVVVVPPPAVVVQPVAVEAPVVAVPTPAPPATVTVRASAPPEPACDLRELSSPDEQVRARAALDAGKRHEHQAVPTLTKLLQEDRSPRVRDSAARGLGLIADPVSLNALQYAAQADDDREVRRSAAFAADVIRGNLRR